jgi:hypothetical protein
MNRHPYGVHGVTSDGSMSVRIRTWGTWWRHRPVSNAASTTISATSSGCTGMYVTGSRRSNGPDHPAGSGCGHGYAVPGSGGESGDLAALRHGEYPGTSHVAQPAGAVPAE